jgi:hypothetical protein
LASVVQNDHYRALLSREHFQIWAEETTSTAQAKHDQQTIPCSFFLTNVHPDGTIVNGQHVMSTNEQVPLHAGDIVALPKAERQSSRLTAWLQFRFDLSRSILRDDGDGVEQEAPSAAITRGLSRSGVDVDSRGECRRLSKSTMQNSPVVDRGSDPTFAQASLEPACLGTSFVGVEMTPLFVLEVGGPAVRPGAAAELRRIVHGMPVDANESEQCPTLLLGRAQQSGFWQRLLCDEAYNSLSRQHLQIEVCRHADLPEEVEFCVRNLSELNPIRVCSRMEDGFDANPPLEKGETRPLHHGDAIVVNPSKDHMLWLVFEHLSSNRLEVASLQPSAFRQVPEDSVCRVPTRSAEHWR